jgi:prefoldin subunit 5
MQTQTQAPPATPAPTQAPAPPLTITVVRPEDGKAQTLTVPTTVEQVANLQAQREELSGQLSNVSSRRSALVSEIQATPEGTARTGLEARLKVLDQRILQIESDLANTGRQISSAPAHLVTFSEAANRSGGDFEEGLMIGGSFVFVFLSVAFFFARRRWKRRRGNLPTHSDADSARLERLEQGMEAIAIEIERVSEGQRFVTKLLSESQAPLGTSLHRIAQAVPVEQKDPATR